MRKLLVLLPAITLMAGAQNPAFEVASIKANRSMTAGSSIRLSVGRISMENDSLKKIILNAYDIPDDREYALTGPDWLTTERFDINATFPPDTPVAQVRKMLQTMLAERFKLILRRETRQLPVYSLGIAKNGPKIRAVEAGQSRTSSGPGKLEATKISMGKLASLLARIEGLPVDDATGLSGVFDFTLEWAPDETPTGNGGPSIFTALQELLGLKLESRKEPVEVLVVDHMERVPTEN